MPISAVERMWVDGIVWDMLYFSVFFTDNVRSCLMASIISAICGPRFIKSDALEWINEIPKTSLYSVHDFVPVSDGWCLASCCSFFGSLTINPVVQDSCVSSLFHIRSRINLKLVQILDLVCLVNFQSVPSISVSDLTPLKGLYPPCLWLAHCLRSCLPAACSASSAKFST